MVELGRICHPDHYEAVLATIWPTKIPDYAAYNTERPGQGAIDLRNRIKAIRKDFD